MHEAIGICVCSCAYASHIVSWHWNWAHCICCCVFAYFSASYWHLRGMTTATRMRQTDAPFDDDDDDEYQSISSNVYATTNNILCVFVYSLSIFLNSKQSVTNNIMLVNKNPQITIQFSVCVSAAVCWLLFMPLLPSYGTLHCAISSTFDVFGLLSYNRKGIVCLCAQDKERR